VPNEGNQPPPPDEFNLPFHLRTILAALWQRRRLFLIVALVAVVLGVAGGYFLGKRTYYAYTILRYVQVSGKSDVGSIMQTEMNQVKIGKNLAKVRFRLSLPATLDELNKAIEVWVQDRSNLMTIRGKWNDGKTAAAIANTMREIYLENWLQAQVTQLERLQVQAESELKNLDSQAEKLGSLIDDLKKQIADEEKQAVKGKTKRANVALRYGRLREAIAEDQARRVNRAALAQTQLEYNRARKLRERDLISPAEFEKTAAAYRRQRAATVDTRKIKEWKSELEKLSTMAAAEQTAQSPTEALLQATLMKSFDLELKRVQQNQEVMDLKNARNYVQEALDGAGSFEPGKDAGTEVKLAQQKDRHLPLHEMLARVLRAYDFDTGSFETVAKADVPVYPVKSTKKLFAIAITLFIMMLGFLAIIAREVLDPTLRSASEIPLRLKLPALGMLPLVTREHLVLPGDPSSPMVEASRVLAERLRVMIPSTDARIILTSAARGEGRTLVAAYLAGAFGRRGEKVILIDAEVRQPRRKTGLEFLCAQPDENQKGLGELLSGRVNKISDVVRETVMPGVSLIPRGRSIDAPEPLGSQAMHDVLEFCSKHAGLTIVVAPPVLPNVDAGLLARWAQALIVVVRSGHTRVAVVQRALRRLETFKVKAMGVILNGVRRPFLDQD